MTLSRSHTPLGESRRELHESVQELDNLLEDLKKAQITDEKCYTKRLDQQSRFYSSTSSLNVPGNRLGGGGSGSRPSSRSSQVALQRVASDAQSELDSCTSRLQSELNKSTEQIPRGVYVKDVVEEEILVDHVMLQPKTQQSDSKIITRTSDRKQSERAKRQVAFKDQSSRYNLEDETYDNTDNEEAEHQRITRDTNQSASMLSLNSATTDQSGMTDSSSVIDPSKVINCYTCGNRVIGQVITALGRNYHKEHFTCAHCGQELGTRNFYERDNLPYCEKDYQSLFSPKCAACNEPILDVSRDFE